MKAPGDASTDMIESGRQEDAEQTKAAPPSLSGRGFFISAGQSAWKWLAAPLAATPDPLGRRRRLLALLVVPIFFVTVYVVVRMLMFEAPGSLRRSVYIPLMLGLEVLLVLAYLLNRAGHYQWAAGLTIAATVIGPWGAAALDPAILRGDALPLAYTIISVILCSILVSTVGTAILAAIELLALAYVALRVPQAGSVSWSGLMTLFFTTSVLSMVNSYVSRRDLRQIDDQTRQLARSEAGLRELSVRDHLTGLFNRRYMEETLEREIRRSARARHSVGVLLLDIDQFKDVNDQWGHAAGDVLLQALGQVLSTHIRGGDIACRWGGDEFVIVLPEASRPATRQRAERLREAVGELEIPYHGLSLGALTISVGLAMYPQHGSSGEALLKSADQALYRAKAEGKNRVVVAELYHPPIA